MSTSTVIRGKVWKFGDNVSTTDITPGEMFMSTAFEPRDIAFAALRPDWRAQVRPGDCIVAGKNFGFGSHRAMANEVMKDLGVSCIVADSIARIYFRNAVAAGCVAISCPGVSRLFREGDELELNILTGEVRNATTGESLQGQAYPPELLEILENGGMIPAIVSRFSK